MGRNRFNVSSFYDPMIAKIIVTANRDQAIQAMSDSLANTQWQELKPILNIYKILLIVKCLKQAHKPHVF
jgi:acetyl/propionyl-CoA carboxylase alpha subunit